jgi:hypothetical protein
VNGLTWRKTGEEMLIELLFGSGGEFLLSGDLVEEGVPTGSQLVSSGIQWFSNLDVEEEPACEAEDQ